MSHSFDKDNRFLLTLPEGWEMIEDDDPSIYSFAKKLNGRGALQISLSKKVNISLPTESDTKKLLNIFIKHLINFS